MAQEVIDPRNIGQPDDLPIAIVPEHLRKFGAVPNFNLCKTGDLIFSYSITQDWVERSISRAQQKGGFANEHSCWTHAAVFLYDTLVAEAVPGIGVRVQSLYEEALQCVRRVRRPRVTDEQRAHIALRAVTMLGTPYATFAALRLGLEMHHGLWNPAALISYGGKVICSKVYFDAHIEIAKLPLSGCPMTGLVSPAHLSVTNDLDDVSVKWVSVTN